MIKYNKDLKLAFKKGEYEMSKLGHSFVGTEHFVLGVLSFNNSSSTLLNKHKITYDVYKEHVINKIGDNKTNSNYIFYTPILKKVIDGATDQAVEFSSKEIQIEHVLLSIIENEIGIGYTILKSMNISMETFYKDLIKLISSNKNLLIDDIGINLNELGKLGKLDRVIGREKEINRMIEILARKNKNNPILIGEAGVGKTALVEGLVTKIIKAEVPSFLKNKIVYSLNLANVISGTKYRGEFEEKLTKIMKEVEENENIIIFIDEVHTLIGAGGAEGAIDASNILKPVLARSSIQIIGATTINEYKKYIESDSALDRRFQKIYVNEPNESETIEILSKVKEDYEKYHNVKINNSIIKKIVVLSKKYIFDRHEPDRSLDILDEVCAKTNVLKNIKDYSELECELNGIKAKKEKALKSHNYVEAEKYKEKENKIIKRFNNYNHSNNVTSDILEYVIESICNSKIYDFNEFDYNNFEIELNNKIVGQSEGVESIIKMLKIHDKKINNKPTSILITGPSGVGKTELAKVLSKIKNLNLIKLNMSEYSNEIAINKILGSPQGYIGYADNNTALEEIKLKPASIILIDEIEKAHISVLNVILNILSEGQIKNSKGDILKFDNSIIIMTSNICNNTSSLGFVSNINHAEIFSKEFTNRINSIINFKPLNKEDIKAIIKSKVKELNNIFEETIIFDKNKISKIIKESDYEINGAKKIESLLLDIFNNEFTKS